MSTDNQHEVLIYNQLEKATLRRGMRIMYTEIKRSDKKELNSKYLSRKCKVIKVKSILIVLNFYLINSLKCSKIKFT